jgi:putative transposase
LDDAHLWRALSYVERNPVRARMVRLAWRYRWSSAAAHVGEGDESALLDVDGWREEWTPARWQRVLRNPEDDDEVESIRRCTHTGRPLGTDRWLSRLETRLGRRLRPLPVGRPRDEMPRRMRARGR